LVLRWINQNLFKKEGFLKIAYGKYFFIVTLIKNIPRLVPGNERKPRVLFSLSGHFNDFVKAFCIKNCQLSQHFAVKLNVGFFQFTDELAVANAVLAGCGINTGDPEATKIAFATFTVAVGVA